MIQSSSIDRFPEFLKFYNCLEFVGGNNYVDAFGYSNIQYYWDYDNAHNKTKKVYLDIMLRFKYCNHLLLLNLSGRCKSGVNMISKIMINQLSENENLSLGFHYEINKDIVVPEFKHTLCMEFDKNMRYKDITDSLIEERGKELYDKLIDGGIIFNNLKPHIETIKDFELLFLKKVDFINDNYSNITTTHLLKIKLST